MKNYVKEYKGHKVPEGATHYNSANMLWPECFINVNSGEVYRLDGARMWVLSQRVMPTTATELPEAPQEWMPEVGEECEVFLTGGWVKCNVKFIGSTVIVYTTHSGEHTRSTDTDFRPLKTQQEKDREAFKLAVDVAILNAELTGGEKVSMIANALFDADFKAPKATDNDQK